MTRALSCFAQCCFVNGNAIRVRPSHDTGGQPSNPGATGDVRRKNTRIRRPSYSQALERGKPARGRKPGAGRKQAQHMREARRRERARARPNTWARQELRSRRQ